jgi:hypothetical protein
LIAICGISARAQYEDGSLIGSIHDATGAAVPNAAVTVTNVNTGNVCIQSHRKRLRRLRSSLAARVAFTTSRPASAGLCARRGQEHHHLRRRPPAHRPDPQGGQGDAPRSKSATSPADRNRDQRARPIGLRLSDRGASAGQPQLLRPAGSVTGSRQAPTAPPPPPSPAWCAPGSYNVNGQRSMFNNFLLDGMDNNAYGESNQGFDNQIISPRPTPSRSSRW